MRIFFLLITIFNFINAHAQQGSWVANIIREDGNQITFTFDWKTEKGKPVWYIKNDAEKIKVDNITASGDSFLVQMPVFESQFKFVLNNNRIEGVWQKRGAAKTLELPFYAMPGNNRFTANAAATKNISGRWAVKFFVNKTTEISVAEFVQKGNHLSGTFLNATGDYRYLEGIVTKDTLLLSGFDGVHAFYFKAIIGNNNSIEQGIFYSGAKQAALLGQSCRYLHC